MTRNVSLVSKINDQIVTQGGQIVQGGDELSIRWRHDFSDKPKAPAGAAKPKLSATPPLSASSPAKPIGQ